MKDSLIGLITKRKIKMGQFYIYKLMKRSLLDNYGMAFVYDDSRGDSHVKSVDFINSHGMAIGVIMFQIL